MCVCVCVCVCVRTHTHTPIDDMHNCGQEKTFTFTRSLHRQLTPMGHSQTEILESNKIKIAYQKNNFYDKKLNLAILFFLRLKKNVSFLIINQFVFIKFLEGTQWHLATEFHLNQYQLDVKKIFAVKEFHCIKRFWQIFFILFCL